MRRRSVSCSLKALAERGLPVLFEPVVDVDLEVDVRTEVARAGRSHVENGGVRHQVGASHLPVASLVVLAEQAEGPADWVTSTYLWPRGSRLGQQAIFRSWSDYSLGQAWV